MQKNILFLVTCVILAALSWGIFHVLGEYAFLIMLVITIVLLLTKTGQAKFGKKPKEPEAH